MSIIALDAEGNAFIQQDDGTWVGPDGEETDPPDDYALQRPDDVLTEGATAGTWPEQE